MFGEEARVIISKAPLMAGVYYFANRNGSIVYVGKSKSLRKRLKSHLAAALSGRLEPKGAALYEEAIDIAYEICPSETEALILECEMIKAFKPKYNSQMVMDRTYPFICISIDDEYPSITIAEKKGLIGAYYGSFYSTADAMGAISLLGDILGTPKCAKDISKGIKSCLDFHLGKCLGPCIRAIPAEEYRLKAQKAQSLLSGKVEGAIRESAKRMRGYSMALDYMRAAEERDKAIALERLGRKARRLDTDIKTGCFALFFRAHNEGSFTAFRIEMGEVTAKKVFDAKSPPSGEELFEFMASGREKFKAGLAKTLLEVHADKYFVRAPMKSSKLKPAMLDKKVREYLSADENIAP